MWTHSTRACYHLLLAMPGHCSAAPPTTGKQCPGMPKAGTRECRKQRKPALWRPQRGEQQAHLQRDLASAFAVPDSQRRRHHGRGGRGQEVEHHKGEGEERRVDAQRGQRVGAHLQRREQSNSEAEGYGQHGE